MALVCRKNFKDGSKGKDKKGLEFTKHFKAGQPYDGQHPDLAKAAGLIHDVSAPAPAEGKPAPAPKKA